MSRNFITAAFGYGLLGLVMGIYMAASKDHSQLVTHAHIMLVGFVLPFVYSVVYKLWHLDGATMMAKVQFYCHHFGTFFLLLGLFMMYGQHASGGALGAVLGVSSLVVLLGFVLMKVMLIKALRSGAALQE